MKDITQVLHDKEAQLERLVKEVKVLRAAVKILSGETGGTPANLNFDIGGEAAEPVIAPSNGRKGLWP